MSTFSENYLLNESLPSDSSVGGVFVPGNLENMLDNIKQTIYNDTIYNDTISNNTVDILMIILQKTIELHEEIKDIKVSLDEHRFIVEDFNDDINEKSKIAGIIGIIILVLGMCCCCLIGCKAG